MTENWRLKRRLKLVRRQQKELEESLWMNVRRTYNGDLTVPLEAHAVGDKRPWLQRWWISGVAIPVRR